MQDGTWQDSPDTNVNYIELKDQQLRPVVMDFKPQVPTRSIQRGIGKIFYVLSGIIGVIGTYFTLRSLNSDDTEMSDRVAYALLLMLAGTLWESAKVSHSLEEDKASDLEEIKEEYKQSLMVSETKYPDDEIKASQIEPNNTPLPSIIELKETIEDDRKSTSATMNAVPRSFSRCRRLLRIGHDLVPATWFTQAFFLFIRNAIQESVDSYLFPYTTVIGLVSGYLFRLSIRPWHLGGLSNWIERDQKALSFIEIILLMDLPYFPFPGKTNILFYATTAAFWTGYSLNDLTSKITNKILGTKIDNKNVKKLIPEELSVLLTKRRTDLLICVSGGVLISSSLILLKFMAEDASGWRNALAQLLSATGCYAVTYPLGVFLGRQIPQRYHSGTLAISTYLLVPFAAPELSILHYLMMMGGGLCGGVCHQIINTRYQNEYSTMQLRLAEIRQSVIHFPAILRQLLDLPLPPDQLLVNKRRQHTIAKWIINLTLLIIPVLNLTTGSLWKHYNTNIFAVIGAISSLIAINWLLSLPKWNSIYDINRPPRFLRFLYFDSFTLVFAFRITSFLFNKTLFNASNQYRGFDGLNSSDIFCVTFGQAIPYLFLIKAAYKRAFGGLLPYVPSSRDIVKLAALIKSEQLMQQIKSTTNTIQLLELNYHLLQFMKKNSKAIFEDETKSLAFAMSDDQATHYEEQKANMSDPLNSPLACLHPLSRLRFFSIPQNSLSGEPKSRNEALPSLPLADLKCQDCQQKFFSVHTGFSKKDRKYTDKRFDISFELRAADAAIRGFGVAHQFQFTLPETLNLVKGVKNFSF